MRSPPDPSAGQSDSGIVRNGVRYVGILSWTDNAGEHRAEIEGPSIVGSAERAHVHVSHPGIARYQAELSVGPDGVEIIDLDSGREIRFKNASIGHAATREACELRFGDVPIRIAFEERPARRSMSVAMSVWSDLWNDTWDRAWDLVHRDEPMVIRGLPGASSDFFASHIHDGTTRSDRPFVSVDCVQRDDDVSLAKMIATRAGVVDWRPGDVPDRTLDVSRAGTLYLRAIQWMSRSVQNDLLQWLRGGPDAPDIGLPKDVRVIVTGEEPLARVLNNGFSEALYFELTALSLPLPRLRHRLGDVPTMVRNIAAECGVRQVPEELIELAVERAHSQEDEMVAGLVIEACMEILSGRTRE